MNPNGGEEETGQPIRLLLDQELVPSAGFLTKIRNKILRRSATAQLAAFSWHLPKVILLELISMVGHLPSVMGNRKRGS